MAVERFRMGLDSTCAECGVDLAIGQVAVWCSGERAIKCPTCAGVSDDLVVPDHRHGEIRQSSLGRHVDDLSPGPPVDGSSSAPPGLPVDTDRKREVAEVLEGVSGIEVLHDRRAPRSKAVIDALVVAPAGVFVLGVQSGTGRVELRDRGGVLHHDIRLYVNGHDRTSLVDGVLDRMECVRRVLDTTYPTVEVHGVICFLGCQWGVLARPKHVHGVAAMGPRRLPEHVTARGPFAALVPAVAYHLGEYLGPAARPGSDGGRTDGYPLEGAADQFGPRVAVTAEIVESEPGGRDQVGDRPVEAASTGNVTPPRAHSPLTLGHFRVWRASVFDEVQRATGPQDSVHLAERGVDIGDGAQRPGDEHVVDRGVIER